MSLRKQRFKITLKKSIDNKPEESISIKCLQNNNLQNTKHTQSINNQKKPESASSGQSDSDSSEAPEGVSQNMQQNISIIKKILNNDETLVFRYIHEPSQQKACFCVVYVNAISNVELICQNVIKPIEETILSGNVISSFAQNFVQNIIHAPIETETTDINQVIFHILSGNSALFAEGLSSAIIISSKKFDMRSIEEPPVEKILSGPREGFVEPLAVNLGLLRRKLNTPNFRTTFKYIGRYSSTKVCICYIEGIANPWVVIELEKRLDSIDIDGAINMGIISELIRDFPYSPFKTVGSTERPDVAASKLLEGRVALFIDGSPVVLTVPFLFVEYFQSSDDYNLNFYSASFNRIIRILCFILTISVPSVYVALTTYHQEMIPTDLIISIAQARQGVPLPTVVETLALLAVFEIVRETSARMPVQIGQTLSIVGALVIGQAAVEARLVSAPIIIVVALSGITSLTIPKLKGAIIFLTIVFIILSSMFGLYGYIFCAAALLLHLFNLQSFGVLYALNVSTSELQDIKDTIIRVPWWRMNLRPKNIAINGNRKRMSSNKTNNQKTP